MENEELTLKKKKAAKLVNIINAGVVAIMLLMCLEETGSGAVFAFFVGCAIAVLNLIFLIIFAVRRWNAFVFCIIWMLVLPIVGFGCCASAFSHNGFH